MRESGQQCPMRRAPGLLQEAASRAEKPQRVAPLLHAKAAPPPTGTRPRHRGSMAGFNARGVAGLTVWPWPLSGATEVQVRQTGSGSCREGMAPGCSSGRPTQSGIKDLTTSCCGALLLSRHPPGQGQGTGALNALQQASECCYASNKCDLTWSVCEGKWPTMSYEESSWTAARGRVPC